MDIHLLNIMMSSDKFKEERTYWQDKLAGDIQIAKALERMGPLADHADSSTANVYSQSIPHELSVRLIHMSGGSNLALYILLLTGFQHLLYRYSGIPDLLIGMPLTLEQAEELDQSHLLAIRGKADGNASFREQVLHVKSEVMSARTYWHFPFDKIAEKLGRLPEESRLQTAVYMKGIHAEPAADSELRTVLEIERTDQQIEIHLHYQGRPVEPSQSERLCSHYIRLLEQAVQSPDESMFPLQLLSTEEELEIMEWNQGAFTFASAERSIISRFQEQVNRTPEQIAIIDGERQITYLALDRQSNQLARLLMSTGVTSGTMVPVMMDNSIELILTILAVFKLGAVYIALHPEYPAARIRRILEETEAGVLITGRMEESGLHTWADTAQSLSSTVDIIHLQDTSWTGQDESALEYEGDLGDLAYVLYTSGSTGQPKGVVVEHRSLSAYVNAFQAEFQLRPGDRMLQQAVSTFDTYMEEVFPALTAGASLVVVDRQQLLDIHGLVDLLDSCEITHVSTTPHILRELNRMPRLRTVRTFISGGDVLKMADIDQLLTYGDVYNTYGPTETTVCALYEKLSESSVEPIPAGKPIQGYFVHIADPHGRMLPVGVPGEICISGPGVARGYYKLREMTNQKFGRSPYAEGERMFRTGDIGMWSAEGQVLFLGRQDHQVKIRGHRIELVEIERHLDRHASVKESIVIPVGSKGEKTLTAYLVSESELYVSEIRGYLRSCLPEYMLPSKYIRITQIPRTIHGKIDVQELMNQKQSLESGTLYSPPESELEHQLVQVWSELFQTESVGIDDDFFQLGGHSLLVIRMEIELERVGHHVQPTMIYDHPTIRELARVLEERNEAALQLGGNHDSLQDSGPGQYSKTLLTNGNGSKTAGTYGYVPFNDVFFKVCFYNSLFPIIMQQKKSIYPFFIHHVDEYLWSDHQQFIVNGWIMCRNDTDILEELGVGFETKVISEDIIQDVEQSLLDARPVIIWVDAYYASIRTDAYLKKHIPHTWLIYAVDPLNQTFTIMEHKHHDNLSYEEKTISYQDLKDSYAGYIQQFNMEAHTFYSFHNRHQPALHQLHASPEQLDHYWQTYADHLEREEARVDSSLERLEQSADAFENLVHNPDSLFSAAEEWVTALHKLVNAKKAELYRCAQLTGSGSPLTVIREQITAEWSSIRAVLAKYVLTSTYKPSSFHKLPEIYRRIAVLEREFYDKVSSTPAIGRF
ncbi:amino acid adenylation domain-containing protein [Paenibacillus sp. FSL R7-0652]|uniref:non-ribosomal peptide synthetase n=1 Tax=Paenibacillus sp. FSL R7-0652 TaxID=2921687 RepID=UPI00315AF3FB